MAVGKTASERFYLTTWTSNGGRVAIRLNWDFPAAMVFEVCINRERLKNLVTLCWWECLDETICSWILVMHKTRRAATSFARILDVVNEVVADDASSAGPVASGVKPGLKQVQRRGTHTSILSYVGRHQSCRKHRATLCRVVVREESAAFGRILIRNHSGCGQKLH